MIVNFVKQIFKEMNRRLLQFLQSENLTQTQFADTLSVARGSVSHILSGRNKPGYDFLESLLLHFPSLNLDWLLTGRGKMYRDAENPIADGAVKVPENRKIERIMVFFDDNTYQTFYTSK